MTIKLGTGSGKTQGSTLGNSYKVQSFLFGQAIDLHDMIEDKRHGTTSDSEEVCDMVAHVRDIIAGLRADGWTDEHFDTAAYDSDQNLWLIDWRDYE